MGFDYLWLSNGLGFSANPWEKTGKIFDGERYYPEKLEKTKEKVFSFWKLFRNECSIPLETRGTNNSVGIDYASDGIPLYDLYTEDLGITAPPNSPWAAINDNYGLEIMGHMTRTCELPSSKFPFRYYIHDPWWINSPWYDRYDGSPCDIYIPMAISRINESGKIDTANSLSIMTINNSFGNMPDACVNEPLPHILKAEKDAPDEISPLVWVYPMREYTTTTSEVLLREMNAGDNFICDAINDGLPLCCVTSTDNFLKHNSELYKKSIIISPIPEETMVLEKLASMSQSGYPVIIYGSAERLKELILPEGIVTVPFGAPTEALRDALNKFGYSIKFTKINKESKSPVIALAAKNNGIFLSAYNPDTTAKTHLRFPLGAPILCGAETEITNGYSSYHFSRAEHRECRAFVEQSDGIISCREAAPVNAKYRRAIKLSGLKDATVRLFSESGCPCVVSTAELTDWTPEIDGRFKTVHDEIYGTYLEGKHVDGSIYFLMGKMISSIED